jgi:serine phosphatase RsbU (regulator of sigma subunit)
MQSTSDRPGFDPQELPRPTTTVCMIVLALAWFLLLLYDLFLSDYSTSLSNDNFLRSLIPLAGLLPVFLRMMRPKDIDDDQEAYRLYFRLTIILLITVGGIVVINILPFDSPGLGTPISLWSLFVGRIIGLVAMLGVPLLAERLLRLYRYRSRRSASRLASVYGWGLVMAILLGLAVPIVTDDPEAMHDVTEIVGGVMALVAFLLSIRLNWIINLRKRQKLAMLGLSIAGIIACVALILMIGRNESVEGALYSLFPGMAVFVHAIAFPMLVTQLGVLFNALLTLPTAEAIDRRNTEVASLSNFARLLTQSFDTEDLINTAITIACDVTGSNAAWIELGDGKSAEILYGTTPRLPAAVAQKLMVADVGRGLPLGAHIRQKNRIEILDRVTGTRWTAAAGETRELRSVAAAPLRLGETMLGVLYVAKEKADAFDREDKMILGAVSDQIALAIEQSRLIKRSIEQERIEQEMLIARDLQQRLLPRVMPISPFYELHAESEPASIVGGDYYDVVCFSDHTLGIVVADVSGKGAAAALYMGMIKGIIQALSGRCADPRELLSRINVALHGSIDQRWFVTMTCAQIIEESRTLRVARAGHCPTLVVRGGRAGYHRANGIGLGLARAGMFDRSLELEDIPFGSGDYAIFLSDGIPEARAVDGEELGYEKLLEIVERSAASATTPLELRNGMFAEISTFTKGEIPSDDSTIAIIRWR